MYRPTTSLASVFGLLVGLFTCERPAAAIDLTFYGDTYIPQRVIQHTGSSAEIPALFRDMQSLLEDSHYNVVNFEGAATTAFVAHEPKRFLLRMPATAPLVLGAAGVNVATLANNHAMDFGYQGVFDTTTALDRAGIAHTGAGSDIGSAMRPLYLVGDEQTYCLLPFSKTLPQSFWATRSRPGTAGGDIALLHSAIKECLARGFGPIVSIHWGQEGERRSQSYQQEIARGLIDAGAWLVVGHHPHVLQELEIHKGRPIVYSLGNFAFGTDPAGIGKQPAAEGMAVGFQAEVDGSAIALVLTPLRVDNRAVVYLPRPLKDGEPDPLLALMPKDHPCVYEKEKRHWLCLFDDRES